MNQVSDFDAAKKQAFDILSRRDHSTFELSRKLKEKGFSEAACAEVISYLKALHLLDDHKFIRKWSRFRLERHSYGPIRLQRELLEKGLPSNEVNLFIKNLSEEWDPEYLAETALLRRYKDPMILKALKNRRRAFDFLQRKGHSKAAIFSAFKKVGVL